MKPMNYSLLQLKTGPPHITVVFSALHHIVMCDDVWCMGSRTWINNNTGVARNFNWREKPKMKNAVMFFGDVIMMNNRHKWF